MCVVRVRVCVCVGLSYARISFLLFPFAVIAFIEEIFVSRSSSFARVSYE